MKFLRSIYRKKFVLQLTILFLSVNLMAQNTIKLEVLEYPGNKKDDSMWSGLYTAKSGKIYIGLCTHADAANSYQERTSNGSKII